MSATEACSVLTEEPLPEKLLSMRIAPEPHNLLSPAENDDQLLQKISPWFAVKKTVYGGRGCFSTRKIDKNTSLLAVKVPVGSAVVRPFRKEVCTWCFHYDDGRTMKFRLQEKIYFCSAKCRSEFTRHDGDGTLQSTMCAVEDLYLKCAGDISEDDVPDTEEQLLDVFDDKWRAVADWEKKTFSTKPARRAKYYPTVTVDDYAEIRYVVSTLHNIARSSTQGEKKSQPASGGSSFLQEMSPERAMRFEIDACNILQSSEMDKVRRYPYLLVSYMNIYKFVRLVSPASWLPHVTPQNVRNIIGRNLTNAFGIWSPTTQEGEEREFFGFGVYPSASFFNHSCAYNVTKRRVGASYEFVATRDILPGEELCISYGINGDETVAQRRACLHEWFFTCGCTRCTAEAGEAS